KSGSPGWSSLRGEDYEGVARRSLARAPIDPRQKAKVTRLSSKGGTPDPFRAADPLQLLPFDFCLLPFAFPFGRRQMLSADVPTRSLHLDGPPADRSTRLLEPVLRRRAPARRRAQSLVPLSSRVRSSGRA